MLRFYLSSTGNGSQFLRARATAIDGLSPRQTSRMSHLGQRLGSAGQSRKSLKPRNRFILFEIDYSTRRTDKRAFCVAFSRKKINKNLFERMSINNFRLSVVQGNMGRGRRLPQSLGALKPENKRPKCQAWRLPIEKQKIINVGKRRTAIFEYKEFYYFCPACNVSFVDFDEYQE